MIPNRTEICIIGAGFTGLSAAYVLAEAGHEVVVLDINRKGEGASRYSGGQIMAGPSLPFSDFIKRHGNNNAIQYWRHSELGIRFIENLVKTYQLSCVLKKGGATLIPSLKALACWEKEVWSRQNLLNDSVTIEHDLSKIIRSTAYSFAIKDPGVRHFDPPDYIDNFYEILTQKGVRFFEGIKVHEFSNGYVHHSKGLLRAQVVLACINAAMNKLPLGHLPGRINSLQARTKPFSADVRERIMPCDAACYDTSRFLRYFRFDEQNRLIFGTRDVFAPFSHKEKLKELRERFIRNQISSVFPDLGSLELETVWSKPVAYMLSMTPRIGQIDDKTFYAYGYGGHGIALSHLYGIALAEKVIKRPETYDFLHALSKKEPARVSQAFFHRLSCMISSTCYS